MSNIEMHKDKRVSLFRRVAIATWANEHDASMLGTTEIDVSETLDYIEAFREAHDEHLTMTHIVARGLAAAFEAVPEANVMLRFGRVYRRKSIGLSLIVMDEKDGRADLSLACLRDVNHSSLGDLVTATTKEIGAVRGGGKSTVSRARKLLRRVPTPLLRASVRTLGFLSFDCNLDLRAIGVPRDPFGSAVITTVGAFGLHTCYAPLVPFARVPMIVTVGGIQRKAVVSEHDKVHVAPVLTLNVTIDHRAIDGYHAAKMTDVLRDWIANPYTHMPIARNVRQIHRSR